MRMEYAGDGFCREGRKEGEDEGGERWRVGQGRERGGRDRGGKEGWRERGERDGGKKRDIGREGEGERRKSTSHTLTLGYLAKI
jgi:hypothetical protein